MKGRVRAAAAWGIAAALTTAMAPLRAAATSAVLIPAPVVHQQHSLDCEAAALQVALSARGTDVTQDWILAQIPVDPRPAVRDGSGHILEWGDPYTAFVGNVDGSEPGGTGYGVYAPPLAAVAERAGHRTMAREGWLPADLYAQVLQGSPAVVWVPVGLGGAAPQAWTAFDGRGVRGFVGEHTETLVGVDMAARTVTLVDPELGVLTGASMARFETAFAALDDMAVVVQGRTAAVVPAPGGTGYWLAATDGAVTPHGSAAALGSMAGTPLSRPVMGMAAAPGGNGYWLVASDGGIFAFGGAPFLGSTGGLRLNQPVVGMAATPSGNGYWLVASDGGIFAFGDAQFFGSTGGLRLNRPVVGMAATPSGRGYWLVASDGGIFAFGDAPFLGSTGALHLVQPVAGMAAHAGGGYWLVARDGGIFSFGAPFLGAATATPPATAVVGMAATSAGDGYWLATAGGIVIPFGAAT